MSSMANTSKRSTLDDLTSTFPGQIYTMLEKKELSHIISWLPRGDAFIVLKPIEFAEEVLPHYCPKMKYPSFKRKLNAWGFIRINEGVYQNGQCHPDFKRNDPEKILTIRRKPQLKPPRSKRSEDEKKQKESTTRAKKKSSSSKRRSKRRRTSSNEQNCTSISGMSTQCQSFSDMSRMSQLRFVSPMTLEDGGLETNATTTAKNDDDDDGNDDYSILTLTSRKRKRSATNNQEENTGPQTIEHNASEIGFPPLLKQRPAKDYTSLPVDPELPQIMSSPSCSDLSLDLSDTMDDYVLDSELLGSDISHRWQLQESAIRALIEKKESLAETQRMLIGITKGFEDDMNKLMRSIPFQQNMMVQSLGQLQQQLMSLVQTQQKLIHKYLTQEEK